MYILKKVKRNIQDYGIPTTIRKSFTSLFGIIFYRKTYRIYKKDLTYYNLNGIQNDEFTFRSLKTGDIHLIRQIEEMAEWLHGSLEKKLSNGDLCIVAMSGALVAGFNLITFGRVYIPLIHLYKEFRKKEAWSEHIAVNPDFRKCGVASKLRQNAFKKLHQRGIYRFYGGTLSTNLPALKLAHKMGFVCFVDVTYGRIMGYHYWRYKRIGK